MSGWFSDTHNTPKVAGGLRVQNKVIKGNNICFGFLVKKKFSKFLWTVSFRFDIESEWGKYWNNYFDYIFLGTHTIQKIPKHI